MMNETIYNISIDSFEKVCNLNQISMLNQLERLPIGLFIFISLALAGLIFHLYITPRLTGLFKDYLEGFGLSLALGSLVWAWLISLSLTFTISEAGYNYIELGALIICILIVIYWCYKNWDKIKEALKDE